MSWSDDWLYYQHFRYIRASGTITDYPISVKIGESSGSVGYDYHCNGHCLPTFDDLRFVNSSGVELHYYIEYITGTTPNQVAHLKVVLDSVGVTAVDFYMWYGNPDATAVSSATDTFILFEDFEGGLGAWTQDTPTNPVTIGTKSFSGTKSARFYNFYGSGLPDPSMSRALIASDNQAISFFCTTIEGFTACSA
jgi:hypothetical protein